jgi:hypothetical protein
MSLAACFSSPTTGPAYLRLPEYLDDYVTEDNPMRVIDVFADLGALLLADCPPPAGAIVFLGMHQPPAFASAPSHGLIMLPRRAVTSINSGMA